jgi:hypothetical protein
VPKANTRTPSPFTRRNLAIAKKTFGPEHPEVRPASFHGEALAALFTEGKESTPDLTCSPRLGSVFFVITGSIVHDGELVLAPNGILVIWQDNSFRDGRKYAKSYASCQIEGDRFLSGNFIRQFRPLTPNEIPWNFDGHLVLTIRPNRPTSGFWDEIQLEIEKLIAHFGRTVSN